MNTADLIEPSAPHTALPDPANPPQTPMREPQPTQEPQPTHPTQEPQPTHPPRHPATPHPGEGYCLVLSGGGAKGVYQIGAWRALKELGIPVTAFVGNSVGAILAGLLAQGLDTELETILASGIGIDSVLRLPEDLVRDGDLHLDIATLPRLHNLARDFIASRGLDTSPLRELLATYLNEQTIRTSGIDLGVVTVNLSDFKPREVFLDAMEEGSLIDYLMASAALPGFTSPIIGGKKYVDGGLYDNLPYAVARRRGYRRIIVIDISGVGMNRRPEISGSQTIYIKNSIDMGGVLDFDPEFLARYTRLGYLDTLRVFGRCEGYSYFIHSDPHIEQRFRDQLAAAPQGTDTAPDSPLVALSSPSSPLFPFRMRHDPRLLLKCLECAASLLDVDRIRMYDYPGIARAIAGRKAEVDTKADNIIFNTTTRPAESGAGEPLPGQENKENSGQVPDRSTDRKTTRTHAQWARHLSAVVRKAIKESSFADSPYFYLRLARAAAGDKVGGLVEKTLAAFVPELEAGMAWFDLGLDTLLARMLEKDARPEAAAAADADADAEAEGPAPSGTLPAGLVETSTGTPGEAAVDDSPVIPVMTRSEASPTPAELQGPEDSRPAANLVRLTEAVPGLATNLRYAGPDNAFGKQLYSSPEAWLLEGTAKKLGRAEKAARTLGFRLLVLDAYRPLSAQRAMWELVPDPDFVAPPERGSIHNRGAAVDITLADPEGRPLPMPSDFDEFSKRASHDYPGGDEASRHNRELLRRIMEDSGFVAYNAEWWHYTDPDLRTAPLLDFEP